MRPPIGDQPFSGALSSVLGLVPSSVTPGIAEGMSATLAALEVLSQIPIVVPMSVSMPSGSAGRS
jgi:hypothetical protein